MKRSTILIGALIATLALHAWCVYEVYTASSGIMEHVHEAHPTLGDRAVVRWESVNQGAGRHGRTVVTRGRMLPVSLAISDVYSQGMPDSDVVKVTYSAGTVLQWIRTENEVGFWYFHILANPSGSPFVATPTTPDFTQISIDPSRAVVSFAMNWLILALSGLALNWLGLTAIRRYRRSRHRCESCGYSAIGLSQCCPECGRAGIESEREST